MDSHYLIRNSSKEFGYYNHCQKWQRSGSVEVVLSFDTYAEFSTTSMGNHTHLWAQSF